MRDDAHNIFVIGAGDAWKVVRPARPSSGFGSRAAALEVARQLAACLRGEGRRTRVFAQSDSGSLALDRDGGEVEEPRTQP